MNDLIELDDQYYMGCALAEGRKAAACDEIPVGAVIVTKSGRIIGRGHNMTEALSDVTAHAEIQAITAAAQSLGGKYLTDCTLYVTVEPCLMCAGAIGWSQLRRIVIGCADDKRGYSTLTKRSPFHPRAQVISGVREDECRQLMQDFFQSKR
jgi:tRNA(adenine34) deaminase